MAALAGQVLAIKDLDIEKRLDAYLLQASSLAITGDHEAAEIAFRLLLRARPEFELPQSTPPKILGTFRKVQAEERAIVEQVRTVARRRIIKDLQFLSSPPSQAHGGRPLAFSLRLRDPTSAVTAVEVPFRRQGETAYSTLALKRDQEGSWRGTIPSDWTASDTGFGLEYYLVTRDGSGPLLTSGGPADPLRLAVAAGTVERRFARPIPRPVFWTTAAATTLAGLAAGGLWLATARAQSDYDRYAQRGQLGTIDGAELTAKASTGHALADATLWTAVGAAVLATATLVMLPFTKRGNTEPGVD